MSDLMIVGDANTDISAQLQGFPQRGCCTFGSTARTGVGGTGVNVAVAAARLGLNVILITTLGKDKNGDEILRLLKNEGVNTKYIKRVDQPTGNVFVVLDESGERTFFALRLNCADWQLQKEDFPIRELARTKALFVTGVVISESKVIKPCANMASFAITQAKRVGVSTFFDPNIRANDWDLSSDVIGELNKNLADCDFFLPNEAELDVIKDKNPSVFKGRAMIVKAGDKGCTVVTAKESNNVPAFSTTVLDTTGAGDSFDAGFIFAFLQGQNYVEAALFASKIAAITVSRVGTITAFPKKKDLMEDCMFLKIKRKDGKC